MSDKGFDAPRQPANIGKPPVSEPTPPVQKEYKIKPGSMVVVKRSDGSIEDGWMALLAQEDKIMVSKIGDNGVEANKVVSVEELTNLNRDADPFRTGAWGISLRRSDGTIENDWISRGQSEAETGFYILEKPDGKGRKLRKIVSLIDLQQLNQ